MIDERLNNILFNEKLRQLDQHNFIASENYASDAVLYFCGSMFANKYAEGYPNKRYYNGCSNYNDLEEYGIELVKRLFKSNFANIQPHSGANANLAVYKAFLNIGDKVLAMDLPSGGHLSHGSPVNLSGEWFNHAYYKVDSNGWIDYEEVREIAKREKPKMIIAGASAYPRQIDFSKFRRIADEVGAILLTDIAHYSGLVAGKAYLSPIPYADVVTASTHKTLRGARGGIILWNNADYTQRINSAVFPGTQGGPLMNQISGKTQAFYEALQPEFNIYAENVIKMARLMCEVFRNQEIEMITGGTDSHMILLRTGNKTGREVADQLEDEYDIIVNRNQLPKTKIGDKHSTGIRIGTAAMVTKKGEDPMYFTKIAHIIANTIKK